MSSKGAKHIVLPAYIVNIGLLYALLLTSSLILALVTIYRHEESIAELREIIQNQPKQYKNSNTPELISTIEDDEELPPDMHQPHFSARELSERSRRHMTDNDATKSSQIFPSRVMEEKGQKGDKGDRGEIGKDGRDGRDGRRGIEGRTGEKGDVGVPGPQGLRGPRGDRGSEGQQGRTGSDGAKGIKGTAGSKGDKGETGENGIHGIKGLKGDRGTGIPKDLLYPHAAHIVGSGGRAHSIPGKTMNFPKVRWRQIHKTGNMTYSRGYLRVGITGLYFIYSQMFYFDGTTKHMGHIMFIDDQEVLKSVYSVINHTKKYQTQFLGGIFYMKAGQKISVGTPFAKLFYFNQSSSFFGAFMLNF